MSENATRTLQETCRSLKTLVTCSLFASFISDGVKSIGVPLKTGSCN